VTITPDSQPGEASAAGAATHKTDGVGLLSIINVFGTIGLTSFGGARAAYFRHALVVARRWLDDDQFLEGLTVSQILPGPNVSNLSAYFGNRLRGIPGSLLATLSFLLPGAAAILILSILYFRHGDIPAIPAIFKGVGAAAVGLSIATTLQVGVKGLRGYRDYVIVVVTFAAIAFLRVPLLLPLLTIAPISIWLWRPRRGQPEPEAVLVPDEDEVEE
jgi:chromate transporter